MSPFRPRSLPRIIADTSGNHNLSPDVSVNPIIHRTLIFSAVRETHPQECHDRYVHYDPRHARSTRSVETTKPYTKQSYIHEINVTVSKQGQRYFIEGTILDIRTGEIIKTEGFVKTIPKRILLHRREASEAMLSVSSLTET